MSGIEIEAKCEGKTTSIKCIRPKWEDIFRGYPKKKKNENDGGEGDKEYTDEVPSIVLYFLFGEDYKIPDACAARLSIALLSSGININIYGDNKITIKEKDVITTETIVLEKITNGKILKGGKNPEEKWFEIALANNLNEKNVILTAERMRHWLWKKWGKADYIVYNPKSLADLQKEFKGKTGVYIMRPIWPGKMPNGEPGFMASGHCTLWTGEDVIGNNYTNAKGGAFAAYLWELK